MKIIGNIIALIGILLFIFAVVGKAVGYTGIFKVPISPIGFLCGTACILLISIIALLNTK